jgi:putative two-component system response regulator
MSSLDIAPTPSPNGDPMDHASHRVLVVDDQPTSRTAHARLVRRMGYQVETAEDGFGALGLMPLGFDLLLVDAEMPYMDGFELASRVRETPSYAHVPIVMITGLPSRDYRRRALDVGINDFVNKPVDAYELQLRAKWLLRLKRAYDRLDGHRAELERTVQDRTEHLRRSLEDVAKLEQATRRAHVDTVRRLMIAAEYRDADTAGHIERIGRYSGLVARRLHLSPSTVELIEQAAPMHDVGKIGIPDAVLLKPGTLDEREWAIMRTHTSMGESILAGSDSPLIQMGERIASTHHERWDGTGYPRGTSGEEIPLEGRICAVVDFFDALSMDRPYRKAVPVDEVLVMMEERAGAHLDPRVLEAFFAVRPEITAMR